MRLGYSSVGGGESFSSYSLTMEDLEEIVAARFGYDPATVNISGLEIEGGEFHVSGRSSPAPADEGSLPSVG
jgi:hypothetical protein